MVLLLGGECKPFVTPSPNLLLIPNPGRGRAGPAGRPWEPTGHGNGAWKLPPTAYFRGQGRAGGWAQPPGPSPFPPRSSLSTQCPSPGEHGAMYALVLSSFWGGGRREGQPPEGGPQRWGSSEDGADTPWAAPPPPAHQGPPWLWSSWFPFTLSLKAGFGHAIPVSPHPPLPTTPPMADPTSGSPLG